MLITGGAGCLGSNLVERYLSTGYELCVLDNFATGKRENLPTAASLQLVEGSITDFDLVDRLFRDFKPTHVIHCAAAYKDPDDWEEDAQTNVLGAIHIARASVTVGVQRIINFQTGLCYGTPTQVPVPVDHALNPAASYSISKTAGEWYLLQSGLNVVSFRLATVLAPRMFTGALPTFYQRLKAGKPCFCSDTVRDFMDVSDFFELIDKALEVDGPRGVYNASPGVGHSMKEIYDLVVEYLKVEVQQQPPILPPGPDDVQVVVLDPAKTGKDFYWQAATPFHQSIRKMLDWYEQYGVSTVYSHVKTPNLRG